MLKRLLKKKDGRRAEAGAATSGKGETGSRHFGSHAFDQPGAHARVVPSSVSSFDEVMHRLEEELRLAGFSVVSAAVGGGGGGSGVGGEKAPSSSSSPPSASPSCPVAPRGSGRAVTLTIFRSGGVGGGGGQGGGSDGRGDDDENEATDKGVPPPTTMPSFDDFLSAKPGLCPLLPSVVSVFESGGTGGDIVVSAAAPAALPSLLLERARTSGRSGGDEVLVEALSTADAALRSALDSVFRLPKAASPPGTYAWPREKLPAEGGPAAVASQRARSQAKRMMEQAR